MTRVLLTERLLLRPPTDEDAAAYGKLCQPLEVARYTLNMPHPYPADGAIEFFKKMNDSSVNGAARFWLMTQREGGTIIGGISLMMNLPHEHAEIGYALGVPFWNQGYASEAVREVVRHGFEDLRLQRIHASYFSGNPASARVLAMNGFTQEGFRPRMYKRFDTWMDQTLVGLLREDWERSLEG